MARLPAKEGSRRRLVICAIIERPKMGLRRHPALTNHGDGDIRRRQCATTESINASGEKGHISMSQSKSKNSEKQSKISKKCWREPKNIRQFASQTNSVATMVLNGEIDMDVARAYATLARVVAQSVSIEVSRSRFLKEAPDLSLDDDD